MSRYGSQLGIVRQNLAAEPAKSRGYRLAYFAKAQDANNRPIDTSSIMARAPAMKTLLTNFAVACQHVATQRKHQADSQLCGWYGQEVGADGHPNTSL